MALSREAELLLLDEPTIGLDAGARHQLFAELLAFMGREDRTILISSHQLADVERFADHCAIIDRASCSSPGAWTSWSAVSAKSMCASRAIPRDLPACGCSSAAALVRPWTSTIVLIAAIAGYLSFLWTRHELRVGRGAYRVAALLGQNTAV